LGLAYKPARLGRGGGDGSVVHPRLSVGVREVDSWGLGVRGGGVMVAPAGIIGDREKITKIMQNPSVAS
jgi:hypothetical protein